MSDRFAALGYSASKLKVNGTGACAAEDAPEGTPLLVLPLQRCWTAAAVDTECPQVSQALAKAALRNPDSELLQAASTKIALHLIWERRRLSNSEPMKEHRKQHLQLLEGRKAETLLAWGRRDLESLTGSFWLEEAHRRQEDVVADLESLLADLGPEVSCKLGLVKEEDMRSLDEVPRASLEAFAWAQCILQELGLHFVSGDQLLAPGLELLGSSQEAGTVLRLEPSFQGSPAVVLYADRDFKAGEGVRLWHHGLACSQGFQLLMGLGDFKVPEKGAPVATTGPWESVEVLLRLPVSAQSSESSKLWSIIEALEAALQASRPWHGGLLLREAVPPDFGWRRVEVIQKEDAELEVQVRLPLGRSLPTPEALQQLGLLICADTERMQTIMREEKGVLDPLGPKACQRRALQQLGRRLQWALEDYPAHALVDARQLSPAEGLLPRRVRGLLLVAAEKQLVSEAITVIQQALQSDLEDSQEAHRALQGVDDAEASDAIARTGDSRDPEGSGAMSEGIKDSIYSLDWDDGAEDGAELTSKDIATLPQFRSQGQPLTHEPDSPLKRLRKGGTCSRGHTGATWEDLALETVLGFSLPALCDVMWRVEPLLPPVYTGSKVMKPGYVEDSKTGLFPAIPKLYEREPSPQRKLALEPAKPVQAPPLRWALLELPGASSPVPEVLAALLALGCEDGLKLQGKLMVQPSYVHRLASGAFSNAASPAKVTAYDVLVVYLEGWLGSKPEQLCVDLLAALQVLVSEMGQSALRVVLLSHLSVGPGSLRGREAVSPASAALGLVRTARAEVPQVPILWLDTDALDGSIQEQLMYEVNLALPPGGLQNASSLERAQGLMAHNREVVYRQGRRWLPRLDLSPHMPVYAGRVVGPLPPHVTETGVALVTGGVGGIGLAAAEALVELGMRRMVVTSRYGQLLDDGKRLEAMRASGCEVIVEACDVAVESSVRELLERIQVHGPLRVVVHASGVLEDAPFVGQDPLGFRKVFEPKALGAWYLHRHTMQDKLHSFVLCSSLAALVGSEGQANYAAASAFLDELARLRAALDLPAISVQWPAVDAWSEEPEQHGGAIWNGLTTGLEKPGSSISLPVVRQVVKLVVAGLKPVEPVQAVLPGAYLSPTSLTVRSMLAPLLARKPNKEGDTSMMLASEDKQASGLCMRSVKLCLQLT
ncbi:unnamed protein product [Effrenium voratum]|uniref:Ketoreductase domain-containing protein n=1 Tax=Effrenium voratum TaxID=2562239 RepID=A0AA36I8A6_9DINO|nr:unnamed protein product [Effrenium voratum]CAJ1412486.1 unnamed protein product [Effrenium voratum]